MALMVAEIVSIKAIMTLFRDISKGYLDSKNASLDDKFYRRSLSLEISKNIHILDRVDFEIFDFSDKEAMTKLLRTLDFKFLEAISKNLKNKDILFESINNDSETSDEPPSKNIHELIYYVITRIYLLENYQTISHLKGIKKIYTRLLLSRIKNSLVLINRILRQGI
jgi:hypothetical protein